MKAMHITAISDMKENKTPLSFVELPVPETGAGEVLLKVKACGVCHTELDEIEGRTPPPNYPVVPGHQVIGTIVSMGNEVSGFAVGDRVGVAWIYSSCGFCGYCERGEENLCSEFKATGRDVDGGYAEYMKVPATSVFPIPKAFSDSEAAPLLCAGAIGYRSVNLTGLQNGQSLGLTGFGASAHLVLKMVRYRFPDTPVFVFARSHKEREFALELGAAWSGDTSERPPGLVETIIDTTPVWRPVIAALEFLKPGGRLVINAIRKEETDKAELLRLNYDKHLWLEKEIKSVANVARSDVKEFLELAARIPLKPDYREYGLEEANIALVELKEQKIRGAKVLRIEQ